MKAYHSEYSRTAPGHYSPAVRCGDMLYISGQLSVDHKTGKVAEGGLRPQVIAALDNVKELLELAGLGLENVVMTRVYVPDVELWPEVNKIYAEYFGSHRPARVVVPTTTLHHGCLCEIEAMASFSDKGITE